jgi:hypothetical protein
MPTSTDEIPRRQHDRDSQPAGRRTDEPRNASPQSHEINTRGRDAYPGYDADLNPVDDEDINTKGSER